MKPKSNAKKIVSSDGLDIYYWVNYTNTDTHFIVLHPGSSMNHSSLESLEEKLNTQGCSTLILDPRGAGFSDKPNNSEYYSLQRYTQDLSKILEQEGIKSPCLVGHSMGFMPIVQYSVDSSNADKVIGICGSYNFSETTVNKVLFHMFNQIGRYLEYVSSFGLSISRFLENQSRIFNDQLSSKNDFDVFCSIVDVSFDEISSHVAGGTQINSWDISEQLKNLNRPLLLIYGSNDPMVTSIAGKYISEIVSNKCNVKMLEGAHSLPILQSEQVCNSILSFLHHNIPYSSNNNKHISP